MERPNAIQVAAACAILKKFAQDTRGTASDTAISSAVYSIFSALSGIGQPAEQYASAVKQATGGDVTVKPMIKRDGEDFEVIADNPLGLTIGKRYHCVNEDEGDDTDDDELPTEAELKRMKKAELLAIAQREEVPGADDGMTNAELVEAILDWRKDKAEESEGNDTPSGE